MPIVNGTIFSTNFGLKADLKTKFERLLMRLEIIFKPLDERQVELVSVVFDIEDVWKVSEQDLAVMVGDWSRSQVLKKVFQYLGFC